MKNDTIAAIATALGNSGISIIRVSGEDAVDIVDGVFVMPSGKRLSECDSHTIHYGHIVYDNDVIDEVMTSVMKAPNSYTGEDVVEINTHGGILVTKKVLSVVVASGARLAKPGEFSKRAFLNGKIDLSRAEAIMDVISAESEMALTNGIKQLNGDVQKKIMELRDILIDDIAHIEAALDDPEHIDIDEYRDELTGNIKHVHKECKKLSESTERGRIIKDGISTVILGKPNAGKSSLMNRMLGTDRAIVTDIEGTTRDSLEESLIIGDVRLKLVDTAGIRSTDDPVEKLGVAKSLEYVRDADLILYVVDSSVSLDDNDKDIICGIVGKKLLIIYNKTDLKEKTDTEKLRMVMKDFGHSESDFRIIPVSVKNNVGMDMVKDSITELYDLGDIKTGNEVMLTNLRHKEAIDSAVLSLENVLNSLHNNMPEDFLTIDMMNAYGSLGEVIGESISDDLADRIFSRFCMGK